MAIFREALMQYLLSKSPITSIVGTSGVWGFMAPQEEVPPYITVTRVAGDTVKNLSGTNGYIEEFWQINCWGPTDAVSELLMEKVIDALDLVAPTTMSPDAGDTDYIVANTMLDNLGPDDEQWKRDGSQNKISRKLPTFRIKRSRAAS